MSSPNAATTETNGGSDSFVACWQRLPNKELFFPLLGAWLLFFHFLGNSTFGYVDTPSLFHWMYNAYVGLNREWVTLWPAHPFEAIGKMLSGDESYGFFIPLIVLGLFWWKRHELFSQPSSVWWPGVLLLAMAILMHMVGYLCQQSRVCVLALFAGIYGLMGIAWGPKWLKASFFPFFLLLFMIPIGSLTDPLTFRLRIMVSKSVAFVCNHIFEIDVHNVGTALISPAGYQYEVAAACSGIRRLMAIAALATIYAFMFFRGWGARILLIGSAVPLAFIGNAVRMLAIVFAAQSGGQARGNEVHESTFWGIVPYIPAMLGLLLLGRWLENRQDKKATADSQMNGDAKQA